MDKTIQRGDLGRHGILFKIVPMHSETKPSDNDYMSCWYKPVSPWFPRAGQSVIPTNLSEFKVCSLLEMNFDSYQLMGSPICSSLRPQVRFSY